MATRYFIALSVVLAGIDQITKYLAIRLVDPERLEALISGQISPERNEIVANFYYLTLTFNKGIAWGMLPEWSEYFTYFAIIMVLVILMILRKLDRDEVWLKIALAFQMAGAIGNMSDRLVNHRVTDFVDMVLFPGTRWQYDWPIFNLADSFVVIGTVVLVLVLVFAKEARPEPSEVQAQPVSGDLSALPASGAWESVERLQGSVPTEEGLVEIPAESRSEMLAPFEEAAFRAEELEEPLGARPPARDEKVQDPDSVIDRDKLDELSKPPERDE